jgi:hypothetical protein
LHLPPAASLLAAHESDQPIGPRSGKPKPQAALAEPQLEARLTDPAASLKSTEKACYVAAAVAVAEEGLSRGIVPKAAVVPGTAGARMVAALAAAEDAEAAEAAAAAAAAAATARPDFNAAAAAGVNPNRLFVRNLSWLEHLARPGLQPRPPSPLGCCDSTTRSDARLGSDARVA